MDFHLPAPGGVGPGNPAALAARGADPAIAVPAGGAHLLRRVTSLVLAPVPGALVPLPTLLAQSVVDLIFCPMVTHEFLPAIQDRAAIVVKVLPTKLDAAAAQLEAEPAGVGLDPTKVYDDLDDLCSNVMAAMQRVRARGRPFHPAYVLAPADVYDLEPVNPASVAAFIAICTPPTALTLAQVSEDGFLTHFGFLSFLFVGNSQSAARDGPLSPTRRVVVQLSAFAVIGNFSATIPAGTIGDAAAINLWLDATASDVVFTRYSPLPSSREQNSRDRHALRYGTADQKVALVADLAMRNPLLKELVHFQRVMGSPARATDAASTGLRLLRLVKQSPTAQLDSIDELRSLNESLLEPARSLSTPGVVVATLNDRISAIERVIRQTSKGPDGKAAPSTAYSLALTALLDSPTSGWRATEAALLVELGAPAPRAVVLIELLTNSSVLGARKLALGAAKDDELSRLLSLSKPLSDTIDFLTIAGGKDSDAIRFRAVADCLVADPLTRLPTTAQQTSFYMTFPDVMARRILRGAFNEIDWVELMRLVLQANNPGLTIQTYAKGIFDPIVPPQLLPLLDRVARFLGIPLAAPAPPAVTPANWATLRTIVVSVAAKFADITGVPDGFESSNISKLKDFEQAAWTEAASVFHRVMGAKNPAGPVLSSVFEPNSGAMAKLVALNTALATQKSTAANQPEMHKLQQEIAEYGSLDKLIEAKMASRPRSRGASSDAPGASRASAPSRSTGRGQSPERGRSSGRDVQPMDDRRSRSKSRERVGSEGTPGAVGSRARDTVRHSADKESFWYLNQKNERASVIYEYAKLEKLTGHSRKELDYPVICSKRRSAQARAEFCGHPEHAAHATAGSPAHIVPWADFAAQAEQLFHKPATREGIVVGNDTPLHFTSLAPGGARRSSSRSASRPRSSSPEVAAVKLDDVAASTAVEPPGSSSKALSFAGLERGRSPHPARRGARDPRSPSRSASRSPSRDRSRSPRLSAPHAVRVSRPSSSSPRPPQQSSSSKAPGAALRAALLLGKKGAAMVVDIAGRARPVADLLQPTVLALRTLVLPVLLRSANEALFLVPIGSQRILEAVAPAPDRDTGCEAATALALQLPLPMLRDSVRAVPVFEHMPAVGDATSCVNRVMALAIVRDEPPPFDGDGASWLTWVPLAMLSAVLYHYALLALARVQTYGKTISRSVLDLLMNVSSRYRTGARAPKLLRRSVSAARRSSRTWHHARVETQAADEVLRRTLLSIDPKAPHAAQLRAFADRIIPANEDEIPFRFKLDGALPDFSDPRLAMTPFATRVQPPTTKPLEPVPPQPSPPSGFRPKDVSDLLTPQGVQELTTWYDDMYQWLLLVDEWSPRLPRIVMGRAQRLDDILEAPSVIDTDFATLFSMDVSHDLTEAARLLNEQPELRRSVRPNAQPHPSLPPWASDISAADAALELQYLETAAATGNEPACSHLRSRGSVLRAISEGAVASDALPKPLRTLVRLVQTHCQRHDDTTEDDIVQLLLGARPEALALGPSRFAPEARGIVWDCRGDSPVPMDFCSPLKTELNVALVRRWRDAYPTWPDKEIFDHLLSGVRFKAPHGYHLVLQPHLASLPLGYVNVHKELNRLIQRGFFSPFYKIPFVPWQTLPMGVAFRKLEPDRPRRTTDGGSPRRGTRSRQATDAFGKGFRRRGASWLVDTDGNKVLPINLSSRWPADDVRRGTLEVFYEAWKNAMPDSRPGSPPPFHPLSTRLGDRSLPPSRAPTPPPSPSNKPVSLAFSGPDGEGSLGAALRQGGLKVEALDKLLGHDLLRPAVADPYLSRARNGDFSFVWIASPCKFFSIGASDRPILFTVDDPLGIPDPPTEWAAYVAQGRAIVDFVFQLILALNASSTPWLAENPSRRHRESSQAYWKEFSSAGTLWDALESLGLPLQVQIEEIELAMCALGAPYQKITTLWASQSAVSVLRAFTDLICPHAARRIPHSKRLRGFDISGESETEKAAAYVPGFVARASAAILALLADSTAYCAPCLEEDDAPARQLTLSSLPAPQALRIGTVFDVDITRGGPTPHFANPFKMGVHGVDGRLRGMAVATYTEWLHARDVPAAQWPTALPVSRRLASLTGTEVERALQDLLDRFGRQSRLHFVCGSRCFGKMCHGVPLVALARQLLTSSADPPFPKELKITVPENMNDAAVLMHVARLTGLPLYQLNTDLADFFNHHRLHPVEEPRVGTVTLDLQLLLKYAGRLRQLHPRICNVAEGALGYGLFPGSEICQRHAYLLCFVHTVEMMVRSAPIVAAMERRYPLLREWRERRSVLEPSPDTADPTAAVRYGQSRLYTTSMYSDDGFKLALGVDLAVLSLTIEIEIMGELKLPLAIVSKQSLGQAGTNQGIRFHTGFGIAYIPQDKSRRAHAGIAAAKAHQATPREYHSTLGLLQSLLFVAGMSRSATFGLWSVFAGGEAMAGDGPLTLPPAAVERLTLWEERLARCAGTSFEAGVERIHEDQRPELPPEAHMVYLLRSDASKQGAALPGLGGAHGGSGWRYPNDVGLSAAELELPIAVTEFAAFYGEIEVYGLEIPDDALVLCGVDALSSVDSLTEEAARSPLMQHVYARLEELPAWQNIRGRAVVAHEEGTRNLMADAFSRGNFSTAQALCRQLTMAYERRSHGPLVAELMAQLVEMLPPTLGPSSSSFLPERDSFEHSSSLSRPLLHELLLHEVERPLSPPPARHTTFPCSSVLLHDLEYEGLLSAPPETASFASPEGRSYSYAMAHPNSNPFEQVAEVSEQAHPVLHHTLPLASPSLDGLLHSEPTLPPLTPCKRSSSGVRVEDAVAGRVAGLLLADTSRLALRPTTFTIHSLCEELYDPGESTPASSARGHRSAWKHWAAWCRLHNTDPWRLEHHVTATDLQREGVLQAGFLRFVHLRQSVRPRDGRKAALPSSASKTLAHVRKMHKDRGFPMVASTLVQVNLRKLLMQYKRQHGVKDLIPHRKQPFTRAILLDTLAATPDGYKLGQYTVQRDSRKWRSVIGLIKTLAQTGFRKAEICVDKHGQPCNVNCLSRGHLRWLLQGKVYSSGSVPQALLQNPGPGDFAILTPPPSKSDPFDMVWGDKPIYLPFDLDPLAAFSALADIEISDSFEGPPGNTALFTGDDGLPFSASQLDTLLYHMLRRHFDPATVRLYSWHSARIFLCCALLASGCPRSLVQALCRWQTDESINVYSCLGASQYAGLLKAAMAVRIDGARAATLADAAPFIDILDVLRAQAASRDSAGGLARVVEQIDDPADPDDDADDD